jgi:ferrous iron transport protein B
MMFARGTATPTPAPAGPAEAAVAADAAAPILLIGNPNVGKSLLFRHLTNHYVTVSNFPGTTVEVVRARAELHGASRELIDSPGVNDLEPRTDDARVTRELLDQHPDATVVQVADAKNLRRALLLTLQLADVGRPMVLVLNMYDELEERCGRVDIARLSAVLGIPVVRTVAPRGEGIDDLIASLPHAAPPIAPDLAPTTGEYATNRARLERINEILAETYSIEETGHAPFGVRLGFWSMHPVRGLGVLAAIMLAVFWFVGLLGAGSFVDLLEVGVFQQRLSPLAIRAVDAVTPFPHEHAIEMIEQSVGLPVTPVHEITIGTLEKSAVVPDYAIPDGAALTAWQRVARFFHDAVVGEFGLITMALSYALAIVLPIVTTFFIVFSMLEDSGYFPRMAILVNRLFRKIGLNGQAVLPMVLGLGCDTMATLTTRILETKKERLVTTMLLALAVPCSAQLGVLLAMMATLSPAGVLVWSGVVIGVLFGVGWLTARVIPGGPAEFVLELPPMRKPQLGNVLLKTSYRLEWYLREVIPLFALGTALLFLLDRVGGLTFLAQIAEPLVTGWLGLPADMANAFLVGFMRRDFGAVYILDAATGADAVLGPHQILVSMVTITLFMPCIANFLVIAHEHGMKTALRMAAFIFPFAFFVGGVIHRLGLWLSIT